MAVTPNSKQTAKKTSVSKRSSAKNKARITVDENIRSYEHDPYFVKKAEKAKALLDRVGLPEGFVRKAS